MIIARIVGGMANQMFPYAAARRLAHQWNTELKLDLRFFSPEIQKKLQFKRHYALGVFNISGQIATDNEIAVFEALNKRSRLVIIKNFIGLPAKPKKIYYRERHFHFDPRVLKLPDNVYLAGNWVCEKYFLDIADIIRSEFTLKEAPTGRNHELLQEVGGVNSVSIHIRRGDYAAIKRIQEVHGVCEIGYYNACIKMLNERIRDPHFYIFSDEPEWAKKHLRIEHPAQYLDHNSPEQGHEDLRIMSNCKHNIIANSGFSWWAAWLNPNPDKLIFAPKNFFRTTKYNTRDLVPKEWIQI